MHKIIVLGKDVITPEIINIQTSMHCIMYTIMYSTLYIQYHFFFY